MNVIVSLLPHSFLGTIGKSPIKWVHTMRDVQPQKFVNVNGQTYIIGVENKPADNVFWEAYRNEKWWKVGFQRWDGTRNIRLVFSP